MQTIMTPHPLANRPVSGNKGEFGRVMVVGGSDGMLGAPALAGRAALRMGAGLVQIAVPQSILVACLSITPELIGMGLEKGVSATFSEDADKADSLVIGPGMGQSDDAFARLKRLAEKSIPAVIDADALNMLAGQSRWPDWFKLMAVLTPHPGEMKRLNKLIGRTDVPRDDAGRIELAAFAAKSFGQILILKGDRSVVTDGDRVYVNNTGDSSLSKAGTGDVLSGMLGCLLAQADDRFLAATTAVWLHGRAGELAGKKFGMRCVLSHDVIDMIPQAVADLEHRVPAKQTETS